MGFSDMLQAKVSAKGWVVIPAKLRRRFKLKPGTIVEFREEGEKIVIIPRNSDPVESLFGKLSSRISLTRVLLDDRASELAREEDDLRTG